MILGAMRNDSVEGASAIDVGWTQKRAVAVTLVTSAAASSATVGLLTLGYVRFVLVSIPGVTANERFLVSAEGASAAGEVGTQEIAVAVTFVTSAAAPTAILCLLTLGFVLWRGRLTAAPLRRHSTFWVLRRFRNKLRFCVLVLCSKRQQRPSGSPFCFQVLFRVLSYATCSCPVVSLWKRKGRRKKGKRIWSWKVFRSL